MFAKKNKVFTLQKGLYRYFIFSSLCTNDSEVVQVYLLIILDKTYSIFKCSLGISERKSFIPDSYERS